jgi:hypothetical protein
MLHFVLEGPIYSYFFLLLPCYFGLPFSYPPPFSSFSELMETYLAQGSPDLPFYPSQPLCLFKCHHLRKSSVPPYPKAPCLRFLCTASPHTDFLHTTILLILFSCLLSLLFLKESNCQENKLLVYLVPCCCQ